MDTVLAVLPAPTPEEVIPREDLAALNIPLEIHRLADLKGVRFDANFVRESLADRVALPSMDAAEISGAAVAALPTLAERLYSNPTQPLAAAELLAASLSHPDELVRVSAAASYTEVALPSQQAPLIHILVEGTRSEDELTRAVAATALARVVPGHPRLLELIRPLSYPEGGEPSHTSLMIHGTWARNNDWWKPGGDFHSYVLAKVDPHLYSAGDFFAWSGAWSDNARLLGALDLNRWVQGHGLDGLDLFTHSHGGSVAMMANSRAIRIGRLVLMSCPVHRNKYWPDFSRLGKVVAIGTRMDLVILADGGGQRFNDPRIKEIVLPIWFTGHSATHDPTTWDKYGLPSQI
jgi:hypothetical protein